MLARTIAPVLLERPSFLNAWLAINEPLAMCQTDATKTVYFNYTNVGLEGGTSFAAPAVAKSTTGVAMSPLVVRTPRTLPPSVSMPVTWTSPVARRPVAKKIVPAVASDMAKRWYSQSARIDCTMNPPPKASRRI